MQLTYYYDGKPASALNSLGRGLNSDSKNFVELMYLRACSKITSGFYEHLLHTYFVENTHRNPAMLVFFAVSVHKILSLNSRTYF